MGNIPPDITTGCQRARSKSALLVTAIVNVQ